MKSLSYLRAGRQLRNVNTLQTHRSNEPSKCSYSSCFNVARSSASVEAILWSCLTHTQPSKINVAVETEFRLFEVFSTFKKFQLSKRSRLENMK